MFTDNKCTYTIGVVDLLILLSFMTLLFGRSCIRWLGIIRVMVAGVPSSKARDNQEKALLEGLKTLVGATCQVLEG